MQKKFRIPDRVRLAGLLFLLLTALTAVLIAAGGMEAWQKSQALAILLPHTPSAYCAFPLLEDNSGRYSVSLKNGSNEILAALKAGTPDAALIPAERLPELDAQIYTAAAVTSCKNLTAVQNGGSAASLLDLNGKSVILPASLQGTPEYEMFRFLLAAANAVPEIAFEGDEDIASRARAGDFDILLLPAQQCADVLMQNSGWRSCFHLASQWRALLGTTPPAGDVLVVRTECIRTNQAAVAALLANLKTGADYIKAKHKKAAQLLAALRLGEEAARIYRTLPHCGFAYLSGEEMEASLRQLSLLTESLRGDAGP